MTRTRDCCFVLWADRFDEAVAAIFVTEFRKAGLRTSLVRAAGQSDTGANGLTLVPDIGIDESRALVDRAACVVIPCSTAAIQQLRIDPRVTDFLHEALVDDVRLVVGQQTDGRASWSESFGSAEMTLYSDQQSVPRLARRIAHQLASSQVRLNRQRIRMSLASPETL
ncbi:MAG: hypothetical protein KDI03_10810 [Anaerolineae bacterium]|nr:hypothetical protein [Anaerolineae bacterium]MCB0203591.1 hypothetical protein [Anaerolineae bacterium]